MAAPNTLCMPRVARLLLLLPNNYEPGVHTQPSCTSLLYLRLHSPLYVGAEEISAGALSKFTSSHDDERERERYMCYIFKRNDWRQSKDDDIYIKDGFSRPASHFSP